MCGLVGIVQDCAAAGGLAEEAGEGRALRRMAAAVRHRGPDGEGFFTAAGSRRRVFLGHVRLAIFDPSAAASQPMTCGRGASEYRAYLPRARWIRDANDSYFAAMTYPQGLPTSQQPSDIHDATWGILSAVYGGAVHPSAEGHAAMADAALPAAAGVLQLDAGVPEVISQPVPPVAPPAPLR